MRKNILLCVGVLLFPLCMQAQISLVSSPITTRGGANNALATNWEAIGVNPSNLGWSTNNDFTASLLNVGFSAQADQLTIPNIGKMTSGDTSLLKQLAASPGGVNIYASVIWAAFSFKVPVVGTFALSIDDKAYGNISLSPGFLNTSDFQTAYAGIASTAFSAATAQSASKNVSVTKGADSALDLNNLFSSYDGSKVSAYEYREVSLSYGRKLFQLGDKDNTDSGASAFKFYGGVGLKYIMGLFNLDGSFNNGTITADYSTVPSNQEFSLFPSGAPGQGYSIDLGLSMEYKKWKFAASVTDLGAINWKGTHASLSDTTIVNNILRDRLDSNSNSGNSTNVNNSVQSTNETYKTLLPSKLRLGASYNFDEYFTFASDIIVPLNDAPGNLVDPYYSIAARMTPVKMLTFDVGFATCKGYGVTIPFGFTVGHKVQFYLGVNDLLSFAGKTKESDLSAAIGLLRINL